MNEEWQQMAITCVGVMFVKITLKKGRILLLFINLMLAKFLIISRKY